MQKINLLPPSFLARKKIAIAWTVVAALIAVEITGVVFGRMALAQQVADLQPVVDTKEKAVADVQALKGQTDSITAEAGIYEPTLKTMQSLKTFNQERPALYQRTARFVYQNATTLSMGSTAGALQLQTYVTNINDLSRTFLYLWSDPDFSSVTLSGVPVFRTRVRRRSDDQNLPPSFITGFSLGMATGFPGGAPGDPYGAGGGPVFGVPGSSGAPGMPGAPGAGPYGAPFGDPAMAAGAGGGPYGAPFSDPGTSAGMSPAGMAGPGMPGGLGGATNSSGLVSAGDGNSGGAPSFGPGAPGDNSSMMAGGMPGMDSSGIDPNAQQNGLVPGIAPWRLPAGAYPLGATVVFTCVLKKPIVRPSVGGGGTPGMPGAPGAPGDMGTTSAGMDPGMAGPGVPGGSGAPPSPTGGP